MQHGDERLGGRREPFRQGARLETRAARAVAVLDEVALALQLGGDARHHVEGLVRGIIQDLDAKAVARPVEGRRRPERADGDLVLVEDGDLQQHGGQLRPGQEGAR